MKKAIHLFARFCHIVEEACSAQLPSGSPQTPSESTNSRGREPDRPGRTLTLTQSVFSQLEILAALKPSFTMATVGSALPVPLGMFVAKLLYPPHRLVEAASFVGALIAVLVAVNIVARWWLGPTLYLSKTLFIAEPNWLGVREALPLSLLPLPALENSTFSIRALGAPSVLRIPGGPRLVVYPGLYQRASLLSFIETARRTQLMATPRT